MWINHKVAFQIYLSQLNTDSDQYEIKLRTEIYFFSSIKF